jgi:hypothetical protein
MIKITVNDPGPGITSFSFVNSSGQIETTVNLKTYPKILIPTIECLVVNDGVKAFTIDEFDASYFYHYSNTAQVGILNFLPIAGVYAEDYSPAELPLLLAPAEEAGFLIRVPWPLEDKALTRFEEACPAALVSGSILGNVIDCLGAHELKLSDNPGWQGTRALSILTGHAGGMHHSSGRYQLDELYTFR